MGISEVPSKTCLKPKCDEVPELEQKTLIMKLGKHTYCQRFTGTSLCNSHHITSTHSNGPPMCLNWSWFTKSKFSENVQETVYNVRHGKKNMLLHAFWLRFYHDILWLRKTVLLQNALCIHKLSFHWVSPSGDSSHICSSHNQVLLKMAVLGI
jgi:hypothetical protein